MEGSPYNPEFDLDSPESIKKPKAETIGSFAVESKPEVDPKVREKKEKLGQALLDMEIRKNTPEKNYELDPALRQYAAAQDEVNHGSTSTSLDGLLQKADAAIDSGKEVPLSQSARKSSQQQTDSTKTRRRWLDIGMITTIVILATLVVTLIISRH